MKINRRSLMRMPLDKLLLIGDYWGVYANVNFNTTTHEWKRRLINKIWFEGYGHEELNCLKSEFAQWRRV